MATDRAALDFAHFANGDGITSEMVLVNLSTQPARPAIYFYDTEGALLPAESVVDVTGDLEIAEDGGLTVWREMEPLGELTISTHGQGPLVTGSVKVVSNGPLAAMLRYDFPGIGEVVVGASPPVGDAVFPVRRQEGGINTAVAIHNLESSPALVRCDLRREGVLLDSVSISLEANGQTSWFIDQKFPAADTSDFTGLVRCAAVGEGRFSAVALEMDPATRTFTTLPVFAEAVSSASGIPVDVRSARPRRRGRVPGEVRNLRARWLATSAYLVSWRAPAGVGASRYYVYVGGCGSRRRITVRAGSSLNYNRIIHASTGSRARGLKTAKFGVAGRNSGGFGPCVDAMTTNF